MSYERCISKGRYLNLQNGKGLSIANWLCSNVINDIFICTGFIKKLSFVSFVSMGLTSANRRCKTRLIVLIYKRDFINTGSLMSLNTDCVVVVTDYVPLRQLCGRHVSIRPIRYPVFQTVPRHPDVDFASLLRRVPELEKNFVVSCLFARLRGTTHLPLGRF